MVILPVAINLITVKTRKMKWKNELTALLGIEYPIVQAPMLGVTTPAMVAAISNNGGLGSLPVGGLSPEKTAELIRHTKELTNKPFAVNLFADNTRYEKGEDIQPMQNFLEKLCRTNNIPFQTQAIEAFHVFSYKDVIEVLLGEDVPIVSFTFGIPEDETIQALKTRGVTLIGTATSVKEAQLLENKGIDIVTAQGFEAGGHRGSFIPDDPLPMVGLMALLAAIQRAVNKPVLAAGGISNGAAIKAAFTMGAKGVQIGTAFIPTDESGASEAHKRAVLEAVETDSVVTNAITGRWARGIRNKLISEIEKSGIPVPSYQKQMSLTSTIRAFALQQNNKDFMALWAGQAGAATEEIVSAASIFKKLISEAEA
jgi:nitronate monooxygenase